MNIIEIPYDTPTGRRTARVFLDAGGLAGSEHGLAELSAELMRRKRAAVSTLSPLEIDEFLDLERPCRPAWSVLQEAYRTELTAATNAKCTSCRKSAITRKYLTLLKTQHKG